MKDFRDLKVWEKAHQLALDCYTVTSGFPKQEIFGMVSQIRRAGSSIATNIAEGCGRGGNAEFQRFLQIAMGSASELEYHFLLSRDLHFLDEERLARGTLHVPERFQTLLSNLPILGVLPDVFEDIEPFLELRVHLGVVDMQGVDRRAQHFGVAIREEDVQTTFR